MNKIEKLKAKIQKLSVELNKAIDEEQLPQPSKNVQTYDIIDFATKYRNYVSKFGYRHSEFVQKGLANEALDILLNAVYTGDFYAWCEKVQQERDSKS